MRMRDGRGLKVVLPGSRVQRHQSRKTWKSVLIFAVSDVIMPFKVVMLMSIDEMLKLIRKELNISQELLARDLNVSYATLNRWENNKAKPSRLAMDKLKDYCASNGISEIIMTELEKYR